jgi:hypothetical protein
MTPDGELDAQALGQDLLLALVNCLTADQTEPDAHASFQEPGRLAQFEVMLVAKPHRVDRMKTICDALGVSD